MLIQLFFNGLIAGGVYALVALGYTMIYGILKFIDFARGELCMVGAFLAYLFYSQIGIPLYLSLPLSMCVTAVLGICVDKLAYKPLRNASRLAPLISAIGVSIFLRSFIALLYGNEIRSLKRSSIINVPYTLFGAAITNVQIWIIITSLILMALIHLFIKKNKIGKAIRAVAEDREAASVLGIETERIISITFGIASALSAAGGVLIGLEQDIEPTMGIMLGFKAFTASVIGGIGSIPGAFLGGFMLGITENFAAGYISSGYKDAVSLIILIFILIIRPRGLFGKD